MKNKILINSKWGFDLIKFISGKLLLQANSGGGKSWAIRRIAEMCFGKIPIIILDTEGEFANLREKYNFILIGKDQDITVNPKTAALLAHRLIEERVSVVIDLLEMLPEQRELFVRNFVQAMTYSPRKLWLPTLLIVDEAQTYAPEGDKTEVGRVLHDAAFKFRKRNFGIIFATPRISVLSKNVISTCRNKMIGYTSLDADMKRAAFELGFTTKEEMLSLRDLDPGEFYVFGPAISKSVIKLTVGSTKTTHGTEGYKSAKVVPPTDKVKKALARLADIPQEAEKEAQTVATLQKEIRELKARPVHTTVKEKEKLTKQEIDTILFPLREEARHAVADAKDWAMGVYKIAKAGGSALLRELDAEMAKAPKAFKATAVVAPVQQKPVPISPAKTEIRGTRPGVVIHDEVGEPKEVKVQGGALRMLKVLVSRYPMQLSRSQLATFAKLKPSSGTYGTYLGTLFTGGLIEKQGDLLRASQAGIDFVGEAPNPPQTAEEVIAMWKENLQGGARRMFEYLVSIRGQSVTREDLGMNCNINPRSGTFGTYLGMLRSNGLITVQGQDVRVAEDLFV